MCVLSVLDVLGVSGFRVSGFRVGRLGVWGIRGLEFT